MVNPTTIDTGVYTVEGNDVVRCEETVQEQTDDTTQSMLSKEIERIVNFDEEFDCRNRLDNKPMKLTGSHA